MLSSSFQACSLGNLFCIASQMIHSVSGFERIRNFCVYDDPSVISIWQADKYSFNIL